MRKLFYFLALILLFKPSYVFSQPNIAVKLYDLKNETIKGLASFDGGNLWILKDKKELVYFNNDEIRTFLIQNDKLSERNFLKIDENQILNLAGSNFKNGSKEKKVSEKITFHWDVTLNASKITSYTIDKDNILILSDKGGDLYFYNLIKKEFLGKLNLAKGDIFSLHTLRNGSIIIIYKNGELAFIEKKVYPLLSFFQTLRDTYLLKNKIDTGTNTIKFMDENEVGDEISLLTGHRILSIYKIPYLTLVKTIKDDKFVECACFFENSLIYSVIEEGKIEGSFSFHRHFNVLSNFYEKKKNIIPSAKGNKFCYITSLASIKVYNLADEKLIGEIGINVKDINDIKFSSDEKFLLIGNNQNKISVYKID